MEPDRKPTTPKCSKPRTDPGSYSWKLLLIKDARVHYVVLKQQPRTTHPTHTTTTNPQGAGHHHTQPDPGSYSWKLLLIKDARVHYVVLKQQPQTTHPTHTNAHVTGAARKPETNKPAPLPHKGKNHGPVASGPNSVPNTTQQPAPAAFLNTRPSQRKREHPY